MIMLEDSSFSDFCLVADTVNSWPASPWLLLFPCTRGKLEVLGDYCLLAETPKQ